MSLRRAASSRRPSVQLRDGSAVELRPPRSSRRTVISPSTPSSSSATAPHTRAWCVHDLQWLLLWAVQDADGQGVDFAAQLDWLVRVLDARDYPLASLADALDTLAGAAGAVAGAADRLRAGAVRVRA